MASERLKRLSIDMPATLYRRFKMVEVLALIERQTAELEEGTTAR
jgi:hypothetical protein